MPEPAGGMASPRIAMRPVDEAALVVVDELAAELNDIARFEAVQPRGEGCVVGDEQ